MPSTQSAFDVFASILQGYGLTIGDDIKTIIQNAVTQGYTPDQMNLILPDIEKTQSFKTRFPGFAQRTANGYNQIDLGQYLDLENQYHRILQQNGLPSGFYDDPSDFGNWIANNVSPDEVSSRVQMAADAVRQVDPTARNMLTKFYGVTGGDLTAYFLDQSRALPTLDRQYKAVNVASWAARNGLDTSNVSRYEDLVDKGVTADQAAAGYGTVASLTSTVGKIANIYGENYNQTDAENDVFFNQSDKRRKIVSAEQANFSGSSKGATGSAQRSSY